MNFTIQFVEWPRMLVMTSFHDVRGDQTGYPGPTALLDI
jgi:hypothetical protein